MTESIDLLSGWVPEDEVTRQARVTARTLRRWRAQPDGPAFMELGGRIYYDVKDFTNRFLPSRRRRPNPRR